MSNKLYYTVFKTGWGWMSILASKAGLLAVTLPQITRQQTLDALRGQTQRAIFSPNLFNDLTEKFHRYFTGGKTNFNEKLDFSRATAFQRQVWEATRLIPYGETRSYGWVAMQINKPQAARAVGQALGKNPFLLIVPCHRVIAMNGGLGGFSCGLEMKLSLLELEKSSSNKRVC